MTTPTATLRTPAPAAAARFGLYQADLDFTSDAAYPRLGFDPATYPDAPNLAPNEDARQGLTLRLVVTAPDGTTESPAGGSGNAGTYFNPAGWPAYVEDAYDVTPAWHGDNVLNAYPRFDRFVRVRYAFQQVAPPESPYTCRLYAYDATAPAGVLCATWTVTVTDTGLAGRARPAPKDPKRLQTQRQALAGDDALLPLGLKSDSTDAAGFLARDNAAVSSGAAGGVLPPVLYRLWANDHTGTGVFGGWRLDDGGGGALGIFCSYGDGCLSPTGPNPWNRAGGRFWFVLAADSNSRAMNFQCPLKPNVAYDVTFWVGVNGSQVPAAGTGVYADAVVRADPSVGDFSHLQTGATALASAMTPNGALVPVTVHVPAQDPHSGANYMEQIELHLTGVPASVSSGYGNNGMFYVGGIDVLDPQGRDAWGEGDFSWHVRPSRKLALNLDGIFAAAEAQGSQFFRVLMFEKTEALWGTVQPNGTSGAYREENVYGDTMAGDSDIPVRRWQRLAAAYLAARWGYSQALAMAEFCNETNYSSYLMSHAATQNLGATLHRWLPGLPVTTSQSWNSAGVDYLQGLYEYNGFGVTLGGAAPARLPDVGCGDNHDYDIESLGIALNLLGGLTRSGWGPSPGAGPNGETTWSLTAAAAAPYLGVAFEPELRPTALRFQGQGDWTVEYDLKGSGGLNADGNFQVFFQPLNGGSFLHCDADVDALGVAVPHTADFGWRHVRKTFHVPTGAAYHMGDSQGFRIQPNNLRSGRYDLMNFRVRDPQGRLWYQFFDDENWTDQDLVSKALSTGRMYGGHQALGCGQPNTGGEVGINDLRHLTLAGTTWNGDSKDPNLLSNALIGFHDAGGTYRPSRDTARHVAQELAWSALTPNAWMPLWWDDVTYYFRNDPATYRAVTAVNAMCRGAGLASGNHYAGEWTVADRNLLTLGTWDHVSGIGVFLLRNRTGCAGNQVGNPAAVVPLTTVATLAGNGVAPIPDGPYTVEFWPTDAPNVVGGVPAPLSSATVAASGGKLAVPVTALSARVGVKVYPPAAAAHLSALAFERGLEFGP